MVEFLIGGDINIAASRILVPIALATVLPNVVVPVSGTVTLGGSSAGTVVVSTVLSPVAVVDSLGGTIATIASPVAVVGTIEDLPALYGFTTVSATVKNSSGVLYSVIASGENALVAGPGTLLVLDGTVATIAVIPVAAGGVVPVPFGPGVGFGKLIASVIGSVDATFVYR